MLFLSSFERCDLTDRHRRTKDGVIRDRIKVVLSYDLGKSVEEIAEMLLLSPRSVSRYIKEYTDEKNLQKRSGGSLERLSLSESELLTEHLDRQVYQRVDAICDYVARNFSQEYSVSGMTRWLHRHGFSYKKPRVIPGKLDQERQALFIERYYSILNQMNDDEQLYFTDAVHPEHRVTPACGWIRKKDTKYIKTNAKNKRLHIMGGVALDTMDVVAIEDETVNYKTTIKFLETLRSQSTFSGKIYLVADNAGYYTKKEVQARAKELNIELIFLPPYSPNLNPIERLWKIMHKNTTYNRYYKTFDEFADSIRAFFKKIPKNMHQYVDTINDNFQTFNNVECKTL